jgi:O-succinylbenzoate synthase
LKPVSLAVAGWKTFRLKLRSGGFRRGILVSFQTPNGRVVFGDASPLPGWSRESLEDVLAALENGSRGSGFPSLQFAREMAMAEADDWAGHPAPISETPLCALIPGGDVNDWMESALRAIAAGARTLKFKIQPETADFLPGFFRWLEGEVPDEIKVRLDANRSMKFADFMNVAERLPGHRVEFVEEPLVEYQRLPELIGVCALPIALDETLREIRADELGAFRGASAVVFKPTLMGGWQACRPYAEIGRAMGMKPVISAAHESGLGIAMLAGLALRYTPGTAAGLDTYSYLEDDILTLPLDFSGYLIRPFQIPPINEQKLD